MPANPAGAESTKIPAPHNLLQSPLHHYPQCWLVVVSLGLLGIYVAWDLNYISAVFALDRSYITSLIAGLVALSTGHAAWHIVCFSQRIEQAQRWLANTDVSAARDRNDPFVRVFIDELNADLAAAASAQNPIETGSITEIFADRLRSPVELGWFLVDLAVRLGLVGTIIGFILIFTTLSDSSISASDGLRRLLVAMSGGMGTALLTTLAGLVAATFLSFQYLILGREVESLIAQLMRIRNRCANATG